MRRFESGKSKFAISLLIKIVLGLLVLVGAASLALSIEGRSDIVTSIGSISLVATLFVVVLYTHYTNLYARASAYPSVSFEVRAPKPGYFRFVIKSHSNVPVRCWCRLNPSYEGYALRFGGKDVEGSFYEAGKPFDVLPYQEVLGAVFDLKVFFRGENVRFYNEIQRHKHEGGFPKLHFNVEFWYEADELGFTSSTIIHKYYYNFGIDKMVLD